MSVPYYGKDCVVMVGGSTVALGHNVTWSIKADVIKDYVFGSQDPSTLAVGDRTYTFAIEHLAVASNITLTQMVAGTSFTLEIRPEGTGGGKKKYTLSNAVFLSFEQKDPQEGLVLVNVSGEAKSFLEGTQ